MNEPSVIAEHGDSIYFMLDQSGDIWSMPKAGGEPRVVVVGDPYDPERGEGSLELWSHPCGLFWLHGNSAPGIPKTLRFVSWSALAPRAALAP